MEIMRSMRLHKKMIGSGLVERAPEPALISIGLPLPGVTVAIPGIIEVNGGGGQTTSTSTHAATTATPKASPTTTAKSGSSGGSGGSSGGSGGSNTQTGSSSTPTGSSSGGSGSSGSGSGNSGGGGSSDSNGSGGDSSGGNSSGSDSSVVSAPGSTPTGSTGTGNNSDNNGDSSNINTNNTDSSGGSKSSGGTSSGDSSSNNSPSGVSSSTPSPSGVSSLDSFPSGSLSAVVNVAGDPSATTSVASADWSGTTVFVSGSVTITSVRGTPTTKGGSGSGSNANGGTSNGNGGSSGGGDPITTDGSGAASGGKISPGVIAAICIVVGLALLLLFLFGLRRWHKNRRSQRLREWADRTKKGGLFLFGANNEKPTAAGSANSNIDGSRSARSSFGTTIEHTRPFSPLPAFDQTLSENIFFTPLVSPTTTAAQSTTSVVPDMPPVSIPQTAVVRSPSRNSSVFSIGTASSHGSQRDSNGAQYLTLPPMQPDNVPQLSPISVRPFSPSESWAFPKPPANPPTPSPSSRPLSETSAVVDLPNPPVSAVHTGDNIPTPVATIAQNPFADTQEDTKQDPFADPQRTPTMPAATPNLDVPVRRPTSSGTMHTMSTAAGSETSIGVLDVIRRPFVPTLSDELAVKRGDQIRVLQCFDDGWAQIEKIETGETGLIPVDCLREAGENLPEFLAGRRVSSYYGGVAV